MKPCPVCRADAAGPAVERHGRFTLHWCRACDVQFSDPMEEAGQAFYETFWHYSGPECRYTSPKTLNWDQRCFLRDRPKAGGRLLDVGGGTGYFLAAAQQRGYQVSGLDFSRPQLEIARQRFGLADLHAESFNDYAQRTPPGLLDVITAFQVLEHVADPLAFLASARQLLAPGGVVTIGVPNWRVWGIFREPLDCPPNHLTRWSRASLRAGLERQGFAVVTIREHRSAYGWMLRHLRLGLLRRAMSRQVSSISGDSACASAARLLAEDETYASIFTRRAVLALSVAKVRTLMAADLPLRGTFAALRIPGVALYALARARE